MEPFWPAFIDSWPFPECCELLTGHAAKEFAFGDLWELCIGELARPRFRSEKRSAEASCKVADCAKQL